ncbi:MAG: FAD synthetase family protein [Parachlamydiales bacterium]|nr:FAD synthetase family protein [Parachlamydiales bacterium]
MQVYYNFDQIKKPLKCSISITIGFFDSIHIGHQNLFKKLNEIKKDGKSCIITFSNHPQSIINPTKKIMLVNSLEERLKLFEKHNIDMVIVLEFTKDFQKLSYNDFLKILKNKLNFSTLVLGKGSKFGNNGIGKEKALKPLQKELNFKLKYIPKTKIGTITVSSTLIREKILKKEYTILNKLLKRKLREKKCRQTYHVE